MGYPSEPAERTEGPAIPGYEVLGKVGEGGMGVVYRVRHVSLNRVEALKTLRLGGPGGPDLVARLRREAEVVARLSDPHVVQVYELGEQGGVPYLTMEFVDGVDLEAKLRGTPLAPRAAARLAETLARTVHTVHREGKVLHRDLKPKNVLLAGPEEAPVEDCLPKITDFGLAKLLGGESGQTAGDAVVGTPAYMPPEQAQGGLSGGVDERADVYSLGAILYETLTGRPPFRAATRLETVLQVLELEPVPPGHLQPGLPRDLETVCLKCLEKSPRKRYASALELAEDLRRFLAGEPIRARPVGRAEKVVRWARRRPAAALLLSALALAPLAAIAGLSEHSRRLRGALERAERGERTARAHLYAARVRLAWQAWQGGDAGRFEELMAQCLPGDDPAAPEGADLRGFEWYYLRGLSRPLRGETVRRAHAGEAFCLAYSPDGSLLASGGQDGLVILWDGRTGRRLRALPGQRGTSTGSPFRPTARRWRRRGMTARCGCGTCRGGGFGSCCHATRSGC